MDENFLIDIGLVVGIIGCVVSNEIVSGVLIIVSIILLIVWIILAIKHKKEVDKLNKM